MKKKWITAALCFAFMMFGMSISAWANTQLQEIKAYLNGELKIRMDGQIVQLKDANGKSVLLFHIRELHIFRSERSPNCWM